MTRAVVAAGDAQTAEAGIEVLRAGGNAIDAVCAAAMASWVVEPPLGSPAGAGLLLHGNADRGIHLLDFFTRVPGLGLPPVDVGALDFHAVTVDYGPTTQDFHVGRGSAALPTCIFGLVEAHRRHGSLPLSEVVQPAAHLARHGWTLSPTIQWVFHLLSPILTLTPSVRRIHCLGDTLAPPNATMHNAGLADFLDEVGRHGQRFLDGDWTDALVREYGPANGGRITRADLAGIEITDRPPLAVPFAGHTLVTPSPPASGGALVALALTLAERLGVPGMAWLGPEWANSVGRILRALSVARGAGFDAHVFEPGAASWLLSEPALERWQHEAAREERHLGGTTHISVLTRDGDCAALTMSNGEGCGHAIEAFGVHVNNFLGEEDINPGGFHARPAGSLMTTMMTPTVVLKDGRPVLVAGTGGANRIRSIVFETVLARIGHGRSLQEAADAPRIHVEGEKLWFETCDLPAGTEAAVLAEWPDASCFTERSMFFGGANLAAREGDSVVGHGDGRRGGRAASLE
ncbi:MAG: gamma-glutamyltransferase [Alphaproteobacteria bacterium]|nr:gamma-glutamyltransferase [Alphaproteobacteria bacterium]